MAITMFKQLLFVVAYYFIDVICTTGWYSSENCLDITHSEIDPLKWLDCKKTTRLGKTSPYIHLIKKKRLGK